MCQEVSRWLPTELVYDPLINLIVRVFLGHLLTYTGTSQYDWYHQIKLPKIFPQTWEILGQQTVPPEN